MFSYPPTLSHLFCPHSCVDIPHVICEVLAERETLHPLSKHDMCCSGLPHPGAGPSCGFRILIQGLAPVGGSSRGDAEGLSLVSVVERERGNHRAAVVSSWSPSWRARFVAWHFDPGIGPIQPSPTTCVLASMKWPPHIQGRAGSTQGSTGN